MNETPFALGMVCGPNPKYEDSSVVCTAACCIKIIVKSLEKNVNHLPQYSIWIFNATIPSDHKSPFTESLVPGTRL